MKAFRLAEIKQLAHELTLAPMRHRLRQLWGINRALELVEAHREYPYSFICFHVTGYRPRRSADGLLAGEDLRADLIELLDRLTAANPIPVAAVSGRLYDAEALARRFNVSTKTISRWRARGLAGAWYQDGDAKPRLSFTARAVEYFVAHHADVVRRGAAFAQMNDAERARIIDRARQIVAAKKCSLHAATVQIAEETGRAVETIRYTLRRFDRENPQQALFDQNEQAKPLDEAELVFEAHLAGESVGQLARRFGRREPQIRVWIRQARAKRLTAEPVAYVYHASFDAADADGLAYVPVERGPVRAGPDETLNRTPSNLPPYLEQLYHTPLLERDEEARLFRQMNYELHRAELARKKLSANLDAATDPEITAVQARLDAAGVIRNRIIQANLRLVVSIAKRHVFGHASLNLFELISDGNVALMRAVEKFDFSRGFRFSTYATWVVTRSFARSVPDELVRLDRFQTGHEEMLTSSGEPVSEEAAPAEQIEATISSTLQLLDTRERAIVERHFGLAGRDPGQTLEQIGSELGISKERVRQIEMRAFAKLRAGLGDRGAELLAG